MINQIISPLNSIDQRIELHSCPACGTEYQTNVPSRVYCSARCQRRAKNSRYKNRNAGIVKSEGTVFEMDRRPDCDYVKDPTEAMIVATAQDREKLRARPVIFYGVVPAITAQLPHGIEFVQQEDGSWLMLA